MIQPIDWRRRVGRGVKTAGSVLGLAVLIACAAPPEEGAVELPMDVTAPAPAAGPDAYALVERALDDGRIGDARTLLQRAVLAAGDTPRARLIAAEVHLASGAYGPAAAAFGQLVADPDVAALALQGKGIALALAEGDAAAGAASLRAAVARDPTLWRAWNALGCYYDARGDWQQANASYNNALAVNPGSAIVLNNRGFSLLMQGRIAEAVADLGEALRRDPSSRPARENLRLALAWDGRYAQALSGTDDDDLGRAFNNIGYIALLRGDRDVAEAYFLRAIEADPAYNAMAARNLHYLRRLRDAEHTDAPRQRR